MHNSHINTSDLERFYDDASPVCPRCECRNSVFRPPITGAQTVPFILLHGMWLHDIGLEVGCRVIIEAAMGQCTVALIGPAEQVERIIPTGPDGVIRQIHFTDVHGDPTRQMSCGV